MSSTIPLYNNRPTPGLHYNAGLRFNKFIDTWKDQLSTDGTWTLTDEDNNAKLNWIKKFTGEQGDIKQLKEFNLRHAALVNYHNGKTSYYKTNANFVTGLGNPHPVENGFTWHHTLGVPYLPGSSIKGIIRQWANQWCDTSDDILLRIFGVDRQEKNKTIGNIIFFDAIPVGAVKLKADIITPHFSEYYTDKTNAVMPGDWLSPKPIPFLVVDEQQSFQFSFIPRAANEHNDDDLERVNEWLKNALDILGTGAKTATGYGMFEHSKIKSSLLEKQKKYIEDEREKRSNRQVLMNEKIVRTNMTKNMQQLYDIESKLSDYQKKTNPEIASTLREMLNKLFKLDFSTWLEQERKSAAKTCTTVYDNIGWHEGSNLNKKQKEKRKAKRQNNIDNIWSK